MVALVYCASEEESSVLLRMDGLNTRRLPPEGREPRDCGKLDMIDILIVVSAYQYTVCKNTESAGFEPAGAFTPRRVSNAVF